MILTDTQVILHRGLYLLAAVFTLIFEKKRLFHLILQFIDCKHRFFDVLATCVLSIRTLFEKSF